MNYRIIINDEPREQLRALPKETRRSIGLRLWKLQEGLSGDIKKLSGQGGKWRLRVGSFRVLFMVESDVITVYAVKNRKDAYD